MAHTPQSQTFAAAGDRATYPVDQPVFPNATRILAIVAHPDDADFAAGGLLIRAQQDGATCALHVMTSGQKGRDGLTHPDEAGFAAMRQAEQRASANILGIDTVTFSDYVDGETAGVHEQMVHTCTGIIREFRPDLLLTSDPYTRLYHQHPDHRRVGAAALEAVFPAAGMNTYYPHQIAAGLEPWWVPNVWLMFSDRADIEIELDDEQLDRKILALSQHWTQRDSHGQDAAAAVRHSAATAGAFAYAETFADAGGTPATTVAAN